MAVTEKDHATASMLKWFIDEQVEEEESATTIIDSLKLVSGDKMGVFMLDKELATRNLYARQRPWPARSNRIHPQEKRIAENSAILFFMKPPVCIKNEIYN